MLGEAIERARKDDDCYVEGVRAEDEALDEGFDATFFEFHGLELARCVWARTRLSKASFYDCTLVGCDFSGAALKGAYFSRCRLVDCKLEGAQLTGAFLRGSRLEGCQCRYLNAGELTLEGTVLERCDLSEAFLSEVALKAKTRLVACDLTRAELFRTRLAGVDLSTCRIGGITLSDTRSELRGAIIATDQAADLVGLLGVRVLD